MTDNVRTWLKHWHKILDAEIPELGAAFDLESALLDPDSNSRMHFSTWGLSDTGLRQCFEILPQGAAMADRAIDMRKRVHSEKHPMSECEALRLLEGAISDCKKFTDSKQLSNPIQILRTTYKAGNLRKLKIWPISELIEGVQWETPDENEQAFFFLKETLYRLANRSFVADYIAWPLKTNYQQLDFYSSFAKLDTEHGYEYGVNQNGPVLLVCSPYSRYFTGVRFMQLMHDVLNTVEGGISADDIFHEIVQRKNIDLSKVRQEDKAELQHLVERELSFMKNAQEIDGKWHLTPAVQR